MCQNSELPEPFSLSKRMIQPEYVLGEEVRAGDDEAVDGGEGPGPGLQAHQPRERVPSSLHPTFPAFFGFILRSFHHFIYLIWDYDVHRCFSLSKGHASSSINN